MNFRKLIGGLVATGALIISAVLPSFAAGTVVVTGNTSAGENMPGWLFNRDVTTSTPFEFNTDVASIGTGSLYVLPIGTTPADKFIGENFINAPIADVNSISYDFQIGGGGVEADEVHFYMNVYANFGESDDLKFYDCRYNIVPSDGSTTGFTTVSFDPSLAYPVTTRTGGSASPYTCPSVPADMDVLSPGSNIRVFALNVGDTAAGDVGLDGYLDNVIVDVDGDVTTYDFEPEVLGCTDPEADNYDPEANTDDGSCTYSPVDKDACKNGGWEDFGFKNQGLCIQYVNTGKDSRL